MSNHLSHHNQRYMPEIHNLSNSFKFARIFYCYFREVLKVSKSSLKRVIKRVEMINTAKSNCKEYEDTKSINTKV